MSKTQAQIADEAGISRSHLSEILAGKKRPSPAVAEALEAASGWSRLWWMYPGKFTKRGRKLSAKEQAE